jgi:hypothetical protein
VVSGGSVDGWGRGQCGWCRGHHARVEPAGDGGRLGRVAATAAARLVRMRVSGGRRGHDVSCLPETLPIFQLCKSNLFRADAFVQVYPSSECVSVSQTRKVVSGTGNEE